MSAPSRILVVEDEPKLASLLADYLRAEGHVVDLLPDGHGAIPALRANSYALVLLDLMLPGRDGLDICRELRRFSDVPVIIVTARVEEIDRLIGLDAGADDYICKPFSPREVVARVRAILRRRNGLLVAGDEAVPGLRIDDAGYVAHYQGQLLDLTPVEFRLLRALAASPGRVFSREQLLDHLYTDHRVVTDRTVDSHIKNLRRKLEQVDPERELIRSIYGVGYKLE